MVGKYYLLIIQKECGLFRVYISADDKHYGHCETIEHPGTLEEVIDDVCAGLDPRLFAVNPVAPFLKEEVIAKAPHAFDAQTW